MPSLGEKTDEYPHGYGFCQCGCGGPTRRLDSGLFLHYVSKSHNPLFLERRHPRRENKTRKCNPRKDKKQTEATGQKNPVVVEEQMPPPGCAEQSKANHPRLKVEPDVDELLDSMLERREREFRFAPRIRPCELDEIEDETGISIKEKSLVERIREFCRATGRRSG